MRQEDLLNQIYDEIGTKSNVTRVISKQDKLYLFIKDNSLVNTEAIMKIENVNSVELERSRLFIQISECVEKEENMAVKFDVAESSATIMKYVGGTENVINLSHCVTRLRFVLKDESIVNKEELKKVKGVLGVTSGGGQFQVILGEALFPIFDYIIKNYNVTKGDLVEENHTEDFKLDKKGANGSKVFNKVITFMSASLTPFITTLFGAGMLRVILTLVSYFAPSAASSYTYQIFNVIAQAPFYFMPVLIAYGVSKVLKSNPIFAITIAVALLYPDFISMANVEGITMFGLPITIVAYKSTLIPALLSSILVAYLEKYFYRVIPGAIRSVFAPLCIFMFGWFATVVVLAPIGYIVGSWLISAINAIRGLVGPFAPALIAGTMMFMVAFGVSQLHIPVMTELFAQLGYDPVFRPAFICHNVAEGASALGVMLKTKNQDLKSSCLSAGIAGIVSGVSEPALYGVNFRFKKTMLSVVIGATVGGTIAGIFGCKAMSMGYSSALGIVLFTDTMGGMALAILASFVIPFVLSYIFYNDNLLEK